MGSRIRSAIGLALLLPCLSSCSLEKRELKALRRAGFTDARLTAYERMTCGMDADFSTGFTATAPEGFQVDGTVCCSVFKEHCTVRW